MDNSKNELIKIIKENIPDDSIIDIDIIISKPISNNSLYSNNKNMIIPSFTEEGKMIISYKYKLN